MKKALLAALTFIVVGFAMVSDTFALPDLDSVFAFVRELGELGRPEQDTQGIVDVELVSSDETRQLYPGGSASHVARVRNSGTGSVCFRMVYAVQYDEASWPKLDISFDAKGYDQTDWKLISIGGVPYRMKTLTYSDVLPSGADSPEVTLTIAMNSTVTSEEISNYRSDFLHVQVLAIDPAPFAEKGYTAGDALNMALPLDTLNPF